MYFKNLIKLGLALCFASTSLAQNTGGTILGTIAPGLITERNYLDKNPDAEANNLNWTLYKDSGSRPVDGTGGTSDFTWARTTTNPISGKGSFLLTKPASNSQGSGVAYNFTIDRKDRYSVLSFILDAELISGTYSNGTSTTDSDLIAYIYDVTNAAVIEPSAFKIQLNAAGLPTKGQVMEFQATSSTSYRLVIHVATTSASAYSVTFDSMQLGRNDAARGPPISDWQSFTPTGAWTTNTTYAGFWRRVGGDAELDYTATLSGAPNATSLTFNIPFGWQIDSAKLSAGTNGVQDLGHCKATNGSGQSFGAIFPQYSTATAIIARHDIQNSSSYDDSSVANNSPWTFASGGRVNCKIRVPIIGWGANTLLSDNSDTRVVSFRAQGTPTGTLNSSANTTIYGTTIKDTHGGYNSSTGEYTVKVPGDYVVSGSVVVNGTYAINTENILGVYINGSRNQVNSNRAQAAVSYLGNVIPAAILNDLKIGDVVTLRTSTGATSPTYSASVTADAHYFAMSRISGPTQVAASEKIYIEYGNNAGTSITGSDANNIIPFATKLQDSHNAWATNTFTAPRAGMYSVKVYLAIVNLGSGARVIVTLQKNGSNFRRLNRTRNNTGGLSTEPNTSMTTSIYLLQGETLKVNVNMDDPTTRSLEASTDVNWITIESQGGN